VNAELILYYVNLLIIQYHIKTKAKATISALVGEEMIYDIAIAVRDGFNLETAIGKQLEILGSIIGVDRLITGASFTRNYFGYALYTDVAPFTYYGYADYTDTSADEQFRLYIEDNRALYDLNDTELRMMLKMQIIKNNSNGSMKAIDDLLLSFFPDQVIFSERYPMGEAFIFAESLRRIATIAQAEDLLPRPSGVNLTVTFVPYISAIFGYKRYGHDAPSFVVGYKRYGVAKTGGYTRYGQT
jgi:hypothetical protein